MRAAARNTTFGDERSRTPRASPSPPFTRPCPDLKQEAAACPYLEGTAECSGSRHPQGHRSCCKLTRERVRRHSATPLTRLTARVCSRRSPPLAAQRPSAY
ncbi:hypothetical protein NDU88_004502 [Pleurodeles waltl]|uniref:Uncharacterized protein n=1 Tax=Pleurodeles waltl TaxID=8319 RepID=A0AAV7VK29_PLEWA|nr:hypothetical protein NDU88_004502 [Pleurodeles waltl]